MIYLRLFYEFAKTGLFAVGGGMATIPFLYAISEKTGWFTAADIGNMIAISESTPGAMGVNMSTYVGFSVKGVLGAVIATLGLVLPSIIVILIISRMLEKFKDSKLVQKIFYGLRPASTGLIIAKRRRSGNRNFLWRQCNTVRGERNFSSGIVFCHL